MSIISVLFWTFGISVLLSAIYRFFNGYEFLKIYHGNHSKTLKLLKNSKIETMKYVFPFLWGQSGLLQILYTLYWKTVKQEKEFEEEKIPDPESSNMLVLDWLKHENTDKVIIAFTGLTGSSKDSYVASLCKYFYKQGYTICVANRMGSLRSPIVDYRCKFLGNQKTLRAVIEHVHAGYPVAKLYGVGYSLGGQNLLYYLTSKLYSKDSLLSGAVALCNPFGMGTTEYDQSQFYKNILVNSLKRWVQRNEEPYIKFEASTVGKERGFSLKEAYTAIDVYDFDNKFTKKLLGIDNVMKEYYQRYAIPGERLQYITIPTIIFHSQDDPVVTYKDVPVEGAKKNENIIVAQSSQGGHCVFAEAKWGIIPRTYSFTERMAYQFFENL
mmetsp:Transcript_10782/g.15788  ORF Transcript_10782/g.15788 Transcript_10782/m.15788 type:complete len:383 (-) Transcript_10782:875-2023(-)